MWSKRNVRNKNSICLLSKKGRSLSGSITIETALVLPIFLFAMLSVMYLTDAVRISAENTAAARAFCCKPSAIMQWTFLLLTQKRLSVVKQRQVDDEDIIDLVKRYHIDVPFDLLNAYDPYTVDRVRVRAFTGYDNLHHKNYDL